MLIVGAGVAGVAIAERLSREAARRGRQIDVLVIDAADHIGGNASRGLQGWYHSGALYTRLERSNSYECCVRSRDLLSRLYAPGSDFASATRCVSGSQRLGSDEPDAPWFGARMSYLIDHADNGHWGACARRIHASIGEGEDEGPFRRVLTHDRAVRTGEVLADLAQAASWAGVRFELGWRLTSRTDTDQGDSLVTLENYRDGRLRVVHARNVVLTVGSELQQHLKAEEKPGAPELSVRSGVVVSTLPALSAASFARVAANPVDNVSHISHTWGQHTYSAMSDSTSLPVDPTRSECHEVARSVLRKVREALGPEQQPPMRIAWHLCRKIERSTDCNDERRFDAWARPLDRAGRTLGVMPGKFSLFPIVAEQACEEVVRSGLFADAPRGTAPRRTIDRTDVAAPFAAVSLGLAPPAKGDDERMWSTLPTRSATVRPEPLNRTRQVHFARARGERVHARGE